MKEINKYMKTHPCIWIGGSNIIKMTTQDFPGGPVVKIPTS